MPIIKSTSYQTHARPHRRTRQHDPKFSELAGLRPPQVALRTQQVVDAMSSDEKVLVSRSHLEADIERRARMSFPRSRWSLVGGRRR
jgi:hypothetical protein